VEQSDADGDGIHLHFCQQIGYFERVRQIRFAGGAQLSFMLLRRENIRATDKVQAIARMVLLDAIENLLQTNHVRDYMKQEHKKHKKHKKPDIQFFVLLVLFVFLLLL
jgi:hypothetical protein